MSLYDELSIPELGPYLPVSSSASPQHIPFQLLPSKPCSGPQATALASRAGRRGPSMPTATYSQEPALRTRVARSVPLQNSTGETEPAGSEEIAGCVKVVEETAEPGHRRRESGTKTRARTGTRAGARIGARTGTHRPGSCGRPQPALRQSPRSGRRHHGPQT